MAGRPLPIPRVYMDGLPASICWKALNLLAPKFGSSDMSAEGGGELGEGGGESSSAMINFLKSRELCLPPGHVHNYYVHIYGHCGPQRSIEPLDCIHCRILLIPTLDPGFGVLFSRSDVGPDYSPDYGPEGSGYS